MSRTRFALSGPRPAGRHNSEARAHIDGKGQTLATEILVATVPVANLIRAEKTYQLLR